MKFQQASPALPQADCGVEVVVAQSLDKIQKIDAMLFLEDPGTFPQRLPAPAPSLPLEGEYQDVAGASGGHDEYPPLEALLDALQVDVEVPVTSPKVDHEDAIGRQCIVATVVELLRGQFGSQPFSIECIQHEYIGRSGMVSHIFGTIAQNDGQPVVILGQKKILSRRSHYRRIEFDGPDARPGQETMDIFGYGTPAQPDDEYFPDIVPEQQEAHHPSGVRKLQFEGRGEAHGTLYRNAPQVQRSHTVLFTHIDTVDRIVVAIEQPADFAYAFAEHHPLSSSNHSGISAACP